MNTHEQDDQSHAFSGDVHKNGRADLRVSRQKDCSPDGTPPEPPQRQQQYRLVNVGEVILATDEVLDDDAVHWRPCPAIGRGMVYGRGYQPLRRRLPMACQYCGPTRYTGLPGGVCENCLGTGLDQPATTDAVEDLLAEAGNERNKHLAVLIRLEQALPDIGVNGWIEGVAAVRHAINALGGQDAPAQENNPPQERPHG